jgi:site-specific recombinase XerD
MELFYFRYDLTPGLADAARAVCIPDGQPFVLDEAGIRFDQFCAEQGIHPGVVESVASGQPNHLGAVVLSHVFGVNEYLIYRTSTSRSPNTWKAEAEQLNIFLRWLKAQGKSWREVMIDDLQAFYRTRCLQPSAHTGRPISRKTWNSGVGAVNRFYKWAESSGLIEKSPFTYRPVYVPSVGIVDKNTLSESVPKEPVRYVTLDEYKLFRQALGSARNGERDKAFADTLLSTGLRLSEANALTVGQVPDPDSPRYGGIKTIPFQITGKGQKTRRIRFPKSTLRAIEIYKGEDRGNAIARWRSKIPGQRSSSPDEPNNLWLTERGTQMSAARWEEVFAGASLKCGIHCTPHMLRHTYAIYTLSALIEQSICSINEFRLRGADQYGKLIHNPLRRLADLLGHSRLATTFLYLDFVEQCEAVVDDAIAEWAKEIP